MLQLVLCRFYTFTLASRSADTKNWTLNLIFTALAMACKDYGWREKCQQCKYSSFAAGNFYIPGHFGFWIVSALLPFRLQILF